MFHQHDSSTTKKILRFGAPRSTALVIIIGRSSFILDCSSFILSIIAFIMGNAASSSPSPASTQASTTNNAKSIANNKSNECPILHHDNKPLNNNSSASVVSSSLDANKTNAPAACPSLVYKNDNIKTEPKEDPATKTFNWWKSLPFSPKDASSSSAPSSSMAPQLPPSLEEAAQYAQYRQYQDQRHPLSTRRAISSIPRPAHTSLAPSNSDAEPKDKTSSPPPPPPPPLPPHQYNTDNPKNHWVYPSEQQYYNAIRRKGHANVTEDLIPIMLQIHNSVNEQGWKQVCYWERIFLGHDTVQETRNQLTLVQLVGRPTDKSVSVYLNQWLYPNHEWFDRHDWYVDRGLGGNNAKPRRYMLDFYEVLPPPHLQHRHPAHGPPPIPKMYLHVRPAMDTPQAVLDRCTMFFRDCFPGTAFMIDQYQHEKRRLQREQQQLEWKMQMQQQQMQQQQQSSTAPPITPTIPKPTDSSNDKSTKS